MPFTKQMFLTLACAPAFTLGLTINSNSDEAATFDAIGANKLKFVEKGSLVKKEYSLVTTTGGSLENLTASGSKDDWTFVCDQMEAGELETLLQEKHVQGSTATALGYFFSLDESLVGANEDAISIELRAILKSNIKNSDKNIKNMYERYVMKTNTHEIVHEQGAHQETWEAIESNMLKFVKKSKLSKTYSLVTSARGSLVAIGSKEEWNFVCDDIQAKVSYVPNKLENIRKNNSEAGKSTTKALGIFFQVGLGRGDGATEELQKILQWNIRNSGGLSYDKNIKTMYNLYSARKLKN